MSINALNRSMIVIPYISRYRLPDLTILRTSKRPQFGHTKVRAPPAVCRMYVYAYTSSITSSSSSHIASIVPSSDMASEMTLLTRTIIAQVACVGFFTSVGSYMFYEITLRTRTIIAQVARVGPFPSVNSHMFCKTTLRTRTIIAQDARVGPFPSV